MGRRRGGLGDLCSRRGLVRRDAPPILFLVAPKRECAAPGGREKALRRGGLRQRRPPAAGGGWLALPCRSQGRKRPALGGVQARGCTGIPLLRFPLPLTLPRRTSQRVATRNARKEKLVKCDLAPRRPPHHPPRVGSWGNRRRPKRARRLGKIGAGTGTPTPVSAEGHCTGARPSGLFFWTVHGPFSFRQDRKENGGCIAQLSS